MSELGVKNGSVQARAARLFYPQEQTSSAGASMSVWCQYPIPYRRGGLRPIVPVLHILFPGTGACRTSNIVATAIPNTF
jgi:hypothetical protein